MADLQMKPDLSDDDEMVHERVPVAGIAMTEKMAKKMAKRGQIPEQHGQNHQMRGGW